jgi:catalase
MVRSSSRRQPDQQPPAPVGPSGRSLEDGEDYRSQAGDVLTSAQGLRLPDTDHSLKAGSRGPTLLEDFHFREKITHFDHERIPERVVHARGAAAHGVFESTGAAAGLTRAAFLGEGVATPVFVRFSTVVGSRGSADTVRDVRGFAVKFYTAEGTFDLVGNNMPVFFIQDAIKFPDLIHAAKPHPDREIPQAQTAHDTFWDFVSAHTEATHMTMWVMSDRAIPRSYRTMQGFGVHTFRLVGADGETSLVKFHWRPAAGIHSLVWEEAQIAAGCDPDYHRRDLALAIENGAFPQWELGVQVFEDTEDETFQGIDLLDPTKIIPEELAPVQPIGRLTLNANPTNYFAETEQVAFHTGHLVPGIEGTNDPLLQGRMFSYLDTQITRLGGPNFAQIPVNRPHAAVNDNSREGFHQSAVHDGVNPYLPSRLEGAARVALRGAAPGASKAPSHGSGTPLSGAYVHFARPVTGPVIRENGNSPVVPVSFDDHYTQATQFWVSMSDVEKTHIVEAFTFELGKCYEQSVRERELAVLARVDPQLCQSVANGLGLSAPDPDRSPASDVAPSPALSQVVTSPGPIAGRVVGVVVADGADLSGVTKLRAALEKEQAQLVLIAEHGGTVRKGGSSLTVDRTFLTVRSIELDGIVVAGGTASTPAAGDIKVHLLLQEAFRHCKAIAAWADGADVLTAAGIPTDRPGVLVSEGATAVHRKDFITALGLHRAWDRFPEFLLGSA